MMRMKEGLGCFLIWYELTLLGISGLSAFSFCVVHFVVLNVVFSGQFCAGFARGERFLIWIFWCLDLLYLVRTDRVKEETMR